MVRMEWREKNGLRTTGTFWGTEEEVTKVIKEHGGTDIKMLNEISIELDIHPDDPDDENDVYEIDWLIG